MPVAVFRTGSQTADFEGLFRSLIPGVRPGMGIRNIFEREREKAVLLIQDCRVTTINDLNLSSTTDDHEALQIWLKLSQELDGSPGLLLPVAIISQDVQEETAVGVTTWPHFIN